MILLSQVSLHSSLCFADQDCEDAFQIENSTCYKVYKHENVSWFTAANRCLSNKGSLAVFGDNVRQYIPSTLLSGQAWIGLLKSSWTWPGFVYDVK